MNPAELMLWFFYINLLQLAQMVLFIGVAALAIGMEAARRKKSEYNKAMRQFGANIKSQCRQIGARLLPILAELADSISEVEKPS